jgi:hypothetical protein
MFIWTMFTIEQPSHAIDRPIECLVRLTTVPEPPRPPAHLEAAQAA